MPVQFEWLRVPELHGDQRFFFLTFPECLHVNIHHPEANREVPIFAAENIPGVKDKSQDFFHGHLILLPIDWRHHWDDTNTELFKAQVFTDHQVLITKPAFDCLLLNDREGLNHAIQNLCGLSTGFSSALIDGIDNGRLQCDAAKDSRKFNHLLLAFPDGHNLSSSEIY